MILQFPLHAQALLDTVMKTNLTPQDWKTMCKATLSGGDHLLWISEFKAYYRKIETFI